MIIGVDAEPNQVHGLTEEQKQRICDFLQGAVYSWCKNRDNEWFSVRVLMGGANTEWEGTPLHDLYLKHLDRQSSDPEDAAGKDAGWLLKRVLYFDYRIFERKEGFNTKEYRWL